MKVELRERYDLYKVGNYIASFKSKDEDLEYLYTEFENGKWRYPDENNRACVFNDMRYSLIRSDKVEFSV